MATGASAVLDRERRSAVPAGLAALGAVALVIASVAVASNVGGGSGTSEYLRNVDAHQSSRLIAAVLQAIGVGLLALPLHYLFRAAAARSDRVRTQFVGVVIAGPIFLAVASVLSGIASVHAAGDFVSNELPQLLSKGVKIGSEQADERAKDVSGGSLLQGLAAGFGIAGQIGLVFGMAYTALHALRTGLLSRFWGSLGVALGVVSFLFFLFSVLWYVYLGLLILGRVPGSRPPAWETGTAVPWPTPGERTSAELSGGESGAEEPERDDPPVGREEPPSASPGRDEGRA